MFKHLIASILLAAIVSLANPIPQLDLGIKQASACQPVSATEKVCGKPAPHKTFKGNKQLKNTITVQVCHRYWNRLDVGFLKGRKTKWWGPTIRYNEWSADLPATDQECKTFWIKPGTVIETYASCVRKVIRTPRMTKPGTYTMS